MRQLPPLLSVASELDPDDAAGWASFGVAAHAVIDGLIEAGELSWRLRVDPEDPPVTLMSTLAAAWRRVSALPGQSQQLM